jgi:cellobiose-specific phosphotransferase system component IIA
VFTQVTRLKEWETGTGIIIQSKEQLMKLSAQTQSDINSNEALIQHHNDAIKKLMKEREEYVQRAHECQTQLIAQIDEHKSLEYAICFCCGCVPNL